MNSNTATQCFFLQTRRLFHYASVQAVFLATAVIFMANSAHAATFVVSNTNDSGAGSFRQAIEDANDNLGFDFVKFDIPGPGIQTIFLLVEFAGPHGAIRINDTVFIDGWTQGGVGYQGPPLIEFRCSGNANSCMHFTSDEFRPSSASGSTMRGIVISESSSRAIDIFGVANLHVDDVTIQGCYIGTDASGTGPGAVGGAGIMVHTGSHNRIGGTQPNQRNVISSVGNVLFDNPAVFIASDHNIVEGNYIGLDRTGTSVLPNVSGVFIDGAKHNRVGGTSPAQRNVISGNLNTGVTINGGTDNLVEGNYIGTLADGVSPAGNGDWGVRIGGSTAGFATRNHVGGVTSSAGNVIADNASGGIRLWAGTTRNTVENNLIGVGADGVTSLGNHGEGILIEDGSLNTIGGSATVGKFKLPAGNTITFNSGTGVRINEGTGNLISRNSIWDNGGRTSGLGIDLSPLGVLGVTPNDDCDLDTGPNRLQNFPIINQVISSAGLVTIGGVLLSGPAGLVPARSGNGMYEIEFFANRSCSGPGNGQGETFIGSTTVFLKERSCSATFKATLNVRLGPGTVITATATDSRNNTSEFSECFPVAGAGS